MEWSITTALADYENIVNMRCSNCLFKKDDIDYGYDVESTHERKYTTCLIMSTEIKHNRAYNCKYYTDNNTEKYKDENISSNTKKSIGYAIELKSKGDEEPEETLFFEDLDYLLSLSDNIKENEEIIQINIIKKETIITKETFLTIEK